MFYDMNYLIREISILETAKEYVKSEKRMAAYSRKIVNLKNMLRLTIKSIRKN